MRTDNPCDSSYILMNKLHPSFNRENMPHKSIIHQQTSLYPNTKVWAKLNTTGIIYISQQETHSNECKMCISELCQSITIAVCSK